MQASQGSSTSRAHVLPALSESLVSALRILLELREECRFAAVKGAGGAREDVLCSIGVLLSEERKNAQGVAGSESRMPEWNVLVVVRSVCGLLDSSEPVCMQGADPQELIRALSRGLYVGVYLKYV